MSEEKLASQVVPAMRVAGDALVASLRGEIDLHNSPLVRSTLLKYIEDNKPQRLILNLGDVPYMDSSAIAVLVEALQKMRKRGGKVFLTNLQPRVKGLLEIARLDTIFGVVPSEAEALAKK
jgi:anti-sigma B factor antagonist